MSYLWYLLKLTDIGDSQTEKKVHEDQGHEENEEEEEDLGNERGAGSVYEVGCEIKLSHQHSKDLRIEV